MDQPADGRAASLPPDLPDDLDPDGADAPVDGSLMEDINAIIADGKTYIEAEIAFQKSRAGYVTDRLKWTAIYGAAAVALLHLALIGLTIGLVIALTSLIGPWLATGVVVTVLLVGALMFVLKLRAKLGDIQDAFGDDPA